MNNLESVWSVLNMARFKGKPESKTPAMRPNTIRRRSSSAVRVNTAESDEALEDALLNGDDGSTQASNL